MPKVRASSGMIGTIRLPMPGSRSRLRSRPANTIVVDAARVPLPVMNSAYSASPGSSSGFDRTTLRGSIPPSARRRISRYSTSSESAPGW